MGKNRSAFGTKKESQHGFLPQSKKVWKQKSVCNGYIVTDEEGVDHWFKDVWPASQFFDSK